MTPVSNLLAAQLRQQNFYPHQPQQRRLYEAAKVAIHQGHLTANLKLPSSRSLAQDLKLARNTIIAAFEFLAEDGYVRSREGSGTFVAEMAKMMNINSPSIPLAAIAATNLSNRGQAISAIAAGSCHEILVFSPEEADFSYFPTSLWQRLQSKAWREMKTDLFDYGRVAGYLPLRQAITDYLNISRPLKLSFDQIIITAGAQQSLDFCAQLLSDAGDSIWMENPCDVSVRRLFQARDLKLHPVAVDAEGMAPDMANLQTDPCLIYLTPSHQYPTGTVLSFARRIELLEIAAKKSAWILEDVSDSEFRCASQPLASLQALDKNQRVIQLGTFSKVFYPDLKLGYLVLPPLLVSAFTAALCDLRRPGQLPQQAALAEFFNRGHFAQHIRKVRQIFATRRELLRRTLTDALPDSQVTISIEKSVSHLLIVLPDHVDDIALVKRIAELGMQVKPLSNHYFAPPIQRGLVVAYAHVKPEHIIQYARLLAKVIQTCLHHETARLSLVD
ncbi:PLP-dependent aminotransferase family protein [Undibacterium sp. RuTC16W]|uniref:MocR-like pyridoxine biosynthesis transcription factor PdxR n=1 Tax=Undibacterium sp. RuTC16W TaxID=3413048 RepID=UPI003BF07176